MLINKKYLLLPVAYNAVRKKLKFIENDKVVFDLDVCLSPVDYDYIYSYDVSRFNGRKIEFVCEPEVKQIDFKLSDIAAENSGGERYRPATHFSASSGWLNDPNGLFYLNGEYHMFYQHNPVGNKWGNMHWGHAQSPDLFNWEHRDEALFPDNMGTMFSGSAIVDYENKSGLGSRENPPVLLFYTAAGGDTAISKGVRFTQCMAFSLDGGKTFEKYENNPVLDHIEADNRDPKVIWCDEMGKFIMALFLSENRYALFCSDNLIQWKQMQSLNLFGDAECPDIYPLVINGEKRYIFSGASDCYMTGDIKGGKFVPRCETKKLHYGKNSYASQTFSGTGDRVIRIAWNTTEAPGMPFNGSMCVPCDMSLENINGEEFLCCMPVKEIEKIKSRLIEKDIVIDSEFSAELAGRAYDVEILIKNIKDHDITFDICGNQLRVFGKEDTISSQDRNMPMCADESRNVKIRLIVDKLGAEIFAGKGQAHMCMGFLSDYSLNRFAVRSDKPVEMNISISELKIK